ncbi:MAG: phenylalanine--tRNA ligase subunit beta [Deltaproteobacteria bacterium RBG_16_44_11]|nr:MAG: phenylalanine--tRNA ligase subunit beta [Deltaproteobacteria bacterium RBG_16_44_11]
MLVSLKWLNDYVDIDLKADELAERLTMSGLEVDSIKVIRPAFDGVVVAKIISVKSHPNADKLSVCEISDGSRKYPVVCGAKNIKSGDIVPLAKVGATIPGGYTIKSSTLRGEKSEGMLCSEAELEIGDDSSGIMQLARNLKLGAPLENALELGDTVLDISITPNRADCLSMIGIAREVAALTGKKIKKPSITVKETSENIKLLTSVKILNPELCPRYTARMIKNIKVGPSPAWLKIRLEAAGMRAINNVVDITNFVMLEMGQPLHAFDFRFLEKSRIIVRKSKKNEEFVSLDGKSRKLQEETLLICDGVKPVAIGGIMGGQNSEVKEDTQIILLESAYFNPVSIRRSARRLAMPTDAAFRFERGIDPEGVLRALNRAAKLIAEFSGGSICKNYIDEYPQKIRAVKNISLRLSRIREVTGAVIPEKDVVRILRSIDMKVTKTTKGKYVVTPPTFRVDITREIDLIEEVIRIYGYDSVPENLPNVAVTQLTTIPRLDLEERIRQIMNSSGYGEIINYSFITPDSVDCLLLPESDERRRFVRIKNPLVEDQSVMRTTMIYGLLDTLKKNLNNGSFNLKIFELGRIFLHRRKGLPEEKNMLAGLLAGSRTDDLWGSKVNSDFFDLKGCLENIFFDLKLENYQYRSDGFEPFLHPGKSCKIFLNGTNIGYLGEIHPQVIEKFDIKNKAYVFEINLDILTNQLKKGIVYKEVSKFPAITRDVAFVVPVTIEADYIVNVVLSQREDLLENVVIFDIYEGKEITEGTKSVGLRFSYRAVDRTLTDIETNSIHDRIIRNIIKLTNARIRG